MIAESFLEACGQAGSFSKEPGDKVEPPKVSEKEAKYYTLEELKNLYTLVEGDRLEIVVCLAGYLGLRREEICGLTWTMSIWKLGNLHQRCPHDGRERDHREGAEKKEHRSEALFADDLLNALH
jgi:integrase